jgi:hypothetical protein
MPISLRDDARDSKRVGPATTLRNCCRQSNTRNAIAKEWRLRISSFATLFYADL